jgi:hypothetical protein
MFETSRYARKPFYIDAIQVTKDNLKEVAEWCNGDIRIDSENNKYIRVRVYLPKNEQQTKAYVGHWVLFAGTGYKVYTPKAFASSFEYAPLEPVSETAPPIFQEPEDVEKRKVS